MESSPRALLALTLGCTFAAALFGLGAEVYSWKSVYGELGREPLIQLARLVVLLFLAATLVLRGGWWGVLAAVAMVVAATLVEWALFPFSYQWAALGDPAGYEEEFGGSVSRPSYLLWASFDIVAVVIAAVLAQGMRLMANADPRHPRGG